jgi:hypothetical protein
MKGLLLLTRRMILTLILITSCKIHVTITNSVNKRKVNQFGVGNKFSSKDSDMMKIDSVALPIPEPADTVKKKN